ncbi:MAG: Flp pilus assembly protein CpaB [Pirellulaceae bacterium]
MRPKSLILIIIALGCGLVASIGISQVLDQKSSTPQVAEVELESIFVALEDIDINEVIEPSMIKLEPWPKDRIPEGAIRDLAKLETRRPRSRLFAGELILEGKLFGSEEDRGAAKLIPHGYRVHSVRVTAESSASGLILPGDRVDVLVYLARVGSTNKSMTRTILKNVRVFAVNEQTHRETDSQGNSIAAKTVSLLVNPGQVEVLMLASRLGSLSLSLRPPDEEVVEGESGDATIQELLGISEDADPKEDRTKVETPQVAAADNRPSFLEFLKEQQARKVTKVATPEEEEVYDMSPDWTMDLLSPTGVQRFEFASDGDLAIELPAGAAQSPPRTMKKPVKKPTSPAPVVGDGTFTPQPTPPAGQPEPSESAKAPVDWAPQDDPSGGDFE